MTFADIDPKTGSSLRKALAFRPSCPDRTIWPDAISRADLVVEATGIAAVAEGLVGFTANGGSCLYFGVCAPTARIEVSPFEVFRRQLTLAGTHSLNHNIPQALDTIAACGPDIEGLVSHHLSLDEVSQILRTGLPEKSMKVQAVLE